MAKPKFLLSKRMVSSRFWTNPDLADLERESGIRNLRLTMIGLWAVADEAGIFEWEPRTLAGLIYPYNSDDQATIFPALDAFVEHKFLLKVEVQGKFYGVWPNWGEHNDFRDNKSRYPEVLATLAKPSGTLRHPPKGTDTLKSPLEVEVEVEAEASTISKQTGKTDAIPQEEKPSALAHPGDSPGPAERLARKLFKLLDQPKDQANNAAVWESQVSALLRGGHSEEEIASVMEFAVKEDDFSAKYLTLAKHPMASFVKTYDNLLKGWKALQKGAAAAANRAAKLKPIATAPGAHGNKSGMEL